MVESLRKLLLWLAWLVARLALPLRYRLHVEGLDQVPVGTGVLIMPCHPAEIDPVIITALFWPKHHARPVAIEDFFYMRGLHWLFRLLRAMPMPNIETGRSGFKLRRMERTLDNVIDAVNEGEAVLFYPAGRLWRSNRESVGGASALHTILQRKPDMPMVLVRTRGLWGSSFSYAQTGRRPDIGKCLLHGAKVLAINLLFFTPRRDVTVHIERVPGSFPRTADRRTLNAWLDGWYNTEEPEPLTLVPYSRWTMAPPGITSLDADSARDAESVPAEIRNGVREEFARMCKRPADSITAEMELRRDLGLDSLEAADILFWLDARFGVTDVEPAELTTVGAVMAAAAGRKGEVRSEPAAEVSAAWFDETRPDLRVPGEDTIPEAFLRTCDCMGTCAACADDMTGVLTYRRLKTAVLLLADAVRAMPGERIGVMLPASVAADLCILGVMLAGKVPVMINWTLGARPMRHVIERAALQVILTSLRFVDNADAPFEELERFFVFLENLRREQFTFRRKLGAALRARRNADVLARQYKLGRIGADDPAVILFTSGSETLPKGVPLTHANLMENMKATVSEAHVTSRERMYGFLPPFHSFGINATALTPLLAGVRVAHYPNPTDARRIAFGIQRYGITLVAGTPTFLRGIVQAARPGQLDTVNLFVAGAEKAPAELQELVAALGTNARLREGYGITECSPIVSLARPYETPVGVGRPLPNVDMQIVNVETHAPLPQGETGMILVSGPSIFSGYIGDDVPDPFVELDGKRWYVTGDLGYLDRDGNLTIAGRLKRFVKIGGEMISLPALEDVLTTRWPGTDEGPRVAVASREREGERPLICAFTTLDTDVDEINSVLRDSGFSALARVHRVRKLDAIPLLGTGKVDYRHLQELID